MGLVYRLRPYLKPEVLIESTSWRWTMKKSNRVGRATKVDPAMMYVWDASNSCWKEEIATWTTQRSRSRVIVTGQRKAFQLARKKKTARAERIGRLRGMMMFQ